MFFSPHPVLFPSSHGWIVTLIFELNLVQSCFDFTFNIRTVCESISVWPVRLNQWRRATEASRDLMMNATMAPLDQLRHDHLEYPRQRTACENALSLREQADGGSGNCGRGIAGDKNKRSSRSSGSTDSYHDNSDFNNGDNSNDNDNNADEDSGGGEGDGESVGNGGNGQDMKHLYNAPSVDYAHGDELFPANQSTTATALTTIPTTTAVTSPVGLAASASSVSVSNIHLRSHSKTLQFIDIYFYILPNNDEFRPNRDTEPFSSNYINSAEEGPEH
jgi:hypothetical protein